MTGLNLISESVAAGLWCPWSRVAAPDEGPTYNRLDAGRERGQPVDPIKSPRMASCIGSKCAAWRWAEEGLGPSRGFCGAAGNP